MNKKKVAAKKKNVVGFDEDEEDVNFDEYLADFENKKKAEEADQMTEVKIHDMEKLELHE